MVLLVLSQLAHSLALVGLHSVVSDGVGRADTCSCQPSHLCLVLIATAIGARSVSLVATSASSVIALVWMVFIQLLLPLCWLRPTEVTVAFFVIVSRCAIDLATAPHWPRHAVVLSLPIPLVCNDVFVPAS